MRKYFFLIMLSLLAASSVKAEEMSVNRAITNILTTKGGDFTAACEYLVAEKEVSTYQFIASLLEGTLYATADSKAVKKESNSSFTFLYPEVCATPADFDSKEVVKIAITRKDRVKFNPISAHFNLYSDSEKSRATAYGIALTKRDTSLCSIIEQCVAKESDEQNKLLANKAYHTLLLFKDSESSQAKALEFLVANEDENSLQIYTDFIAQQNPMGDNLDVAKKRVIKLEINAKNNKIIQNLFSGLSLGSILVLIALGLSIIYGLAGVINMSHGEFLMIGAYTTYCMQQLFAAFLPEALFDLAFFLSIPMSFIVAALFGLAVERLVIRHLYSRPLESLLATLGVSLVLIQLARSIFGDLTSVKAPAILSGGVEIASGLILPYNRLFVIGLTVLVFIGVYFLFQKSRLGIKIRAVSQNRNMSASVGISTQKVDMITFMIGSGLAGVAGCAITLIGNVVPNMGQTYIVDSFLVVVTGGVGKLAGCVTSGLGIGVLSKLFENGFEAVYGKVLMLLLIVIFLQYRPKGLFADKGRIGDD